LLADSEDGTKRKIEKQRALEESSEREKLEAMKEQVECIVALGKQASFELEKDKEMNARLR
jgi:hypothetical protein